jgi:putative hydrolase
MTGLRLDQDYQVHSTFSDDAKSSLFENIRAAESAGLRTMCLVDHARASTAWVPDMVDAVDDLRPRAGLSLLVGVEVKMLDRTGLLDSPEPVVGVDHILIADHQYPSEDGPVQPTAVRRMLAEGSLLPAEVAECLVEATVGATGRRERPIVAHPFSFLRKLGLHEDVLDQRLLRHFAACARRGGVVVEVNEKWRCPGPMVVAELSRQGVRLVAGSDSHQSGGVGQFRYVREVERRVEAIVAPAPTVREPVATGDLRGDRVLLRRAEREASPRATSGRKVDVQLAAQRSHDSL